MILPRLLRSASDDPCKCHVCCAATSKCHDARKLKKKRGRPSLVVSDTPTQSAIKVCGHCFSKIQRGHSHSKTDCSSRRQKVMNLESLVKSPKTEQIFACRVIDRTNSGELFTLGPKPKRVACTPRSDLKPKKLYSAEGVSTIQKDLNLSNVQTYQLAQDLRLGSGSRKIIETDLRTNLHEINHELDNFFEKRKLRFVVELKGKPSEAFEQWTVVCNDLPKLIDHIISKRNIQEEDALVRNGIDGGG